jgi:hypothetical protein
MFGKKGDTEKSPISSRCDPGKADARVYSLESIMRVQKALENGIEEEEEERVPDTRPMLPEHGCRNGQIMSVDLMRRLRNLPAAIASWLSYSMQFIVTRKRQFRRTSAR